jgi:hypothetical protein
MNKYTAACIATIIIKKQEYSQIRRQSMADETRVLVLAVTRKGAFIFESDQARQNW